MTIVSLEKTKVYIINWIKDYATNAGIKTLVVGLSGGVDSALVALLCKKTHIPTLCVSMPCHSSETSYSLAKAFAKEQGLNFVKIDLSAAHDIIFAQSLGIDIAEKTGFTFNPYRPIAIGGLRSCLRTPTLSYYANATHGLIVGTGNRSEDNLIRYFNKFGDGCVDISPIGDLFKSEVYELFAYMTTEQHIEDAHNIHYISPPASSAIYKATPTADLLVGDTQSDEEELELSYDEIEWADRENIRCGIITTKTDPANHKAWGGYSMRQREVIAKIHQLEKISRHKYNSNLPVCHIRNKKGLVR